MMERTGRCRTALEIVTTLVLATGWVGPAQAAFIFTFLEHNGDVIVTGSGSIDLSGLSQIGTDVLLNSGIIAQVAVVGVAGTVTVYTGITGPGSLGLGGSITASSSGGDASAVNGSIGVLGVPMGYSSGSALSNSLVFTDQTFDSLGLTPGTYNWVWGSGAAADSLTVQIGPTAIPEPASVLLVGVGLLGLAAARYRGKSDTNL